MPTLKNILDEFDKLCFLNQDGDCKYWRPEAFGYHERDDEAPLDKFFPEHIKNFLSQSVKTALESVVPKRKETYKDNRNIIYDSKQVGYNACRDELLKNIEEYLKN